MLVITTLVIKTLVITTLVITTLVIKTLVIKTLVITTFAFVAISFTRAQGLTASKGYQDLSQAQLQGSKFEKCWPAPALHKSGQSR